MATRKNVRIGLPSVLLLTLLMVLTSCSLIQQNGSEPPALKGKLVFHRYAKLDDWNAKLFLLDFAKNSLTEISQGWAIDNPINAHFSPDGSKIVFMGAEAGTKDWDIFLWNVGSSQPPENLTRGNNLKDEDPKFSPDGTRIVFKQEGDIKEMNLNKAITNTITSDGWAVEDSMPFYTTDGLKVIYASSIPNPDRSVQDKSSDLYISNKDGSNKQALAIEPNLQEYYPIARDGSTFLYVRDYSSSNPTDQIYLGYYDGKSPERLFCNQDSGGSIVDSGDPYPYGSQYVFFSRSIVKDNKTSYDLYLADIKSQTLWSLDSYNSGVNSSLNELGASYSDAIFYTQDFSSSPSEWITNNGANYYWRGSPNYDYYIKCVNDSGDYAYVPIPNGIKGSFRFELDFRMESNDYAAGIIFGLFDDPMISHGPNETTHIIISYGTGDFGNALDCYGRGSDNVAWSAARQYPSSWQHATWYHQVLSYDASNRTVHLVVTEGKGLGGSLQQDVTATNVYYNTLTRFGFSQIGTGCQVPGASGIGEIDNVMLCLSP